MPGIKTMNIIVSALLATAGAYAAPFQKRGMDQVVSQCNHNFAYTFDDGPYDWNTDLVNKFDSVGAKTTFFVNGNNWRCIYSEANVKALRFAFGQGHLFASHTWSHADITKLTEAKIDEEIERLDEAFVKIIGVKPKLFRPPYGAIDERTASYIQSKHGKTIVLWDLDSGDTATGADEQGSIDFYENLAAEGPASKHLTLSHEVHNYSVKAAENGAVDALHNKGITLLTVAECLDTTPYEIVGEPGVRDDTWTCEGAWKGAPVPDPSTTISTATSATSVSDASSAPSTATLASSSSDSSSAPPTAPSTTGTSDSSSAPSIAPSTTGVSYSSSAPLTTTSATGASDSSSAPPTTTSATSASDSLSAPSTATSVTGASDSSSAPSTTPTSICKETYTSVTGDDCTTIEAKYNLVQGTLKAANSFVTCDDIWARTPLCIPNGPYNPTTPTSTVTTTPSAPACKQTYSSVPNDTCSSIENKFNLVEGTIKAANAFLTCTDIWAWTPICIPDGPYKSNGGSEPSCVTQKYQGLAGETCSTIETKFALQAGSVSAANTWVNCSDIWASTNLSICVPTLSASDPQRCTKPVTASTATTCAALGAANGVSAAWIKAWNPWVNCADIWQGTNLCVAH